MCKLNLFPQPTRKQLLLWLNQRFAGRLHITHLPHCHVDGSKFAAVESLALLECANGLIYLFRRNNISYMNKKKIITYVEQTLVETTGALILTLCTATYWRYRVDLW